MFKATAHVSLCTFKKDKKISINVRDLNNNEKYFLNFCYGLFYIFFLSHQTIGSIPLIHKNTYKFNKKKLV